MKNEKQNTYQGWTNYETWAVALWLTNDESSYRYWQEITLEYVEYAPDCPQVMDGVWTQEQAARFKLADRIETEVSDASPLADDSSLYADLLSASLSEVNWREIADSWLEDAN